MRVAELNIGVQLTLSAFTVAAVTTVVFALIHAVPGDPVDILLGEYAATVDRSAMRAQLGLDRPLLMQWLSFFAGAVRFDFGQSLITGESVGGLVRFHLRYTALLASCALLVAIAVGIPVGIVAACRQGRFADRASMVLVLLALAVPNFVLGPMLIWLFAIVFKWLPAGGAETPGALILPAFTLGLSMAALLARMTRAVMLDTLDQPYMQAAKARGLWPYQRLLHALRNAALPIVTIIGLQLGALLGGAVITEAVFAWPGLGQLLVDSIHRRDYPVVQASVLIISVTYVLLNNFTEIVYRWLDPRIGQTP